MRLLCLILSDYLYYLTYKITYSFLNMCKLEAQKTLFTMLSSLHHQNLSDNDMEFFQKNSFDYSFEVKEPVSIFQKYISEHFCKQAAFDLPRNMDESLDLELKVIGQMVWIFLK